MNPPRAVSHVALVTLLSSATFGSMLVTVPVHIAARAYTDVRLHTIPGRVFVDNDGIVESFPTESVLFFVVVDDDTGSPLQPLEARIELLSKGQVVQTSELHDRALQGLRGTRFTAARIAVREAFDLRHSFSVPVALNVDLVRYRLTLNRGGASLATGLEIPLERYEPTAELVFPVKGRFMIVAGHDANEPHAQGWSQQHACDIMLLGPTFGFARNGGRRNEDYFGWSQPVLAPANGTVVFARTDVPDQLRPGAMDAKSYDTLPDSRSASTGNTVVIDHGHGEFSALSHLRKGSVKVATGDRVRRGEEIGRLGSSGSSELPHLHYQLMAGPDLFRSDGLPARFSNVWLEAFTTTVMRVPKAKRGIPLTAR